MLGTNYYTDCYFEQQRLFEQDRQRYQDAFYRPSYYTNSYSSTAGMAQLGNSYSREAHYSPPPKPKRIIDELKAEVNEWLKDTI